MKVKVVSSVLLALMLTACGSDENVKTEEYQFADGLRLLDIPPDLTRPEKNLVMEIPKPSLRACEILMEADKKYQAEKKKKDAGKKAEADQQKQ